MSQAAAADPQPTLTEWLAWLAQLNPAGIELGLTRIRRVAGRLGVLAPPVPVISVAGTNGKGSTVTLLAAILAAAGYRVGSYTSPHLIRYNERIQINAQPVSDTLICKAFSDIESVRRQERLTYFEFGTLAALRIFQASAVDVYLLEVGLGGRLDAVNIVAADAAIITSIGLDHTEWLGSDRDQIGSEKAGICRPRRPAIVGDPQPPAGLLAQIETVGAIPYCLNQAFSCHTQTDTWTWCGPNQRHTELPYPSLAGAAQVRNAATALMALDCLSARLPVPTQAMRTGLNQASLPGRLQRFPGPVDWILDIAHNTQAAGELAAFLAAEPVAGRSFVVLAMQGDKDAAGFAAVLDQQATAWHVAGLSGRRARDGASLAAVIQPVVAHAVHVHTDLPTALAAAEQAAAPGDRLVVCGSFWAVTEALAYRGSHQT